MGLGSLLKVAFPLSIYLAGVLAAIRAMGGNARWALLLVTFLLPLRNVIERVQSFPLGNQFIDILLLSVIIGWVSTNKNKSLFEKSPLNGISIILIVYTFISMVLGGHYLTGSFGVDIHDPRVQDWKNFSLLPVLFYVVLNNTPTKKEVWLIIVTMCCSMIFMNYYTINQIFWYSSLEARSKITGTFQFLGPNEVAAFFNEYTLILMTLYFAMKKGIKKYALLALILGNLYCILFTYSRGAYAGLVVGMLILFSLKKRLLLIPLVLALLFWQSLPEKVVERIKETKTSTGQLDESSQRRINIWEQSFELFKTNPITGIGFGVFRYLGLDLGDTHNIYVKILTEQGLVGFILFLITIFCFMRQSFQLYQKGEDDLSKALGLGLFICMFVLLVNNLFGDRWSYMEPNAYLWIFAGIVARLNAISTNPQAQLVKDKVEKKISSSDRPSVEKIKKKVRYYDL